jgi:hypothetical protein
MESQCTDAGSYRIIIFLTLKSYALHLFAKKNYYISFIYRESAPTNNQQWSSNRYFLSVCNGT